MPVSQSSIFPCLQLILSGFVFNAVCEPKIIYTRIRFCKGQLPSSFDYDTLKISYLLKIYK